MVADDGGPPVLDVGHQKNPKSDFLLEMKNLTSYQQ